MALTITYAILEIQDGIPLNYQEVNLFEEKNTIKNVTKEANCLSVVFEGL